MGTKTLSGLVLDMPGVQVETGYDRTVSAFTTLFFADGSAELTIQPSGPSPITFIAVRSR